MKPEIKKLWIDALLGGKYKQGIGALKKDGKFCCLGVLTDLYRKETGSMKWGRHSADYMAPVINGEEEAPYFLPVAVMKWAGLHKVNPRDLAWKNDSGYTFKDIAGIVEKL